MKKSILISGAGIAGCALAWWLTKAGHSVTVVEKSGILRTGGYGIDIRGAAVEVIKKMGLEEKCRGQSSGATTSLFVNEDNEVLVSLPSAIMEMQSEGDMEMIRGDLLQALYDITKGQTVYKFGQSITSINQASNGVWVGLNGAEPVFFDMLIGADGLHSNVRALCFGKEEGYSYSFGDYFFAFFSSAKFDMKDDEVFYSMPNKTINMYSPGGEKGSKVLFIIKEDGFNFRDNPIAAISTLFEGKGWKTPELLDELVKADDLYVDQIKQIRMEKWFDRNVALLGDAAFAPSLATGQGTSMAIVSAYVLARELSSAGGNPEIAFPAYQEALKKYVKLNQKMGKNVKNMVAKNENILRWQIRFLRILSKSKFLAGMMKKGMAKAANAVKL